ncbi:LTA synthase family protein [Butyrivibrio sp. VCD2006]|uniref:LTA synthase family protein n=1 Tax=Butyrivibrio sp. VCD2006 TaxID=1280664 RepID=UPI0018CA05AE|nr:LTA synthase family protein [Butyrivibrio sp. VCD2006]
MALPLVFVLLFFGYFPLHYDIVLHTDNVKGEGICQTYVCPTVGMAAFYTVGFYFGSELKKATIKGYHYDVNPIELIISDVSEFEITGIDSYCKGIHLGHFRPTDILNSGETVEGTFSKMASQNGVLHIDVKDSDVGATIKFSLPFIPVWFRIVYFAGIILISLIFSIVFTYIFERIKWLQIFVMHATCIAVTLLAGCFFCGSLPYVTYNNFLLNWLFLFAFSLVLNGITLPFLGTIFTMAFTTIWYIANYFVITLRNKPIMPADLKAIGTAKEVMGGYTFVPSWQMLLGIAVVVVYAVLLILIWKENKKEAEKDTVKRGIIKRCLTIGTAALLMVVGINTQTFKSLSSFAWDVVLLKSFHAEGMVTTYLKSAINAHVKKPDGYSSELLNKYLSEYESNPGKDDTAIHPTNIIMVMNEAFSDLRIVGMDDSIDVMPFIDSLDENTIKGELSVGVFGGGTCNTEFEALTGNTLAFLGAGAYPYTENVTDKMFSLASYLRDIGYDTEAFHPNVPQNWNRNTVYQYFGFDRFHSISDFESFGEITYLHNQPADVTDYRYIEAVDEKIKESPRFLFDVTMQNHSGYERWLDVEKAGTVEENGNNLYVDTQVYLSLIKASDDAVKQLVEKYQDSDEPTMIVFFGDHQPGLPGAAINEIYTDLESQLDLYKSKFFIWTNYDTEEQSDVQISANYLPWLILEQGNFRLPPYIQMLKELHEKYPIISSQGVMDKDGNIYTGVAEVMDDPLIKKYQYIQYANLFDEIDSAWFEFK